MRLHMQAFGLLLAGLSLASASVFQRQCYAETVTVTETMCDNHHGRETHTATFTEFRTMTVQPRTTTMVRDTITLAGPTFTVTETETLEGLYSSSSARVNTSTSLSTENVPGNCTGSVSCTQQQSHPSRVTYSLTKTFSATTTLHLVSTAVVVPLPTLLPSPPTNEKTSTVISLISPTTAETAGPASSLPSSQITVTVGVTETIEMTSYISITLTTAPFPTLSVTGTMGISPVSGNGTAGSSGFGSAGGAGTAPTPSDLTLTPPIVPVNTRGPVTSNNTTSDTRLTASASLMATSKTSNSQNLSVSATQSTLNGTLSVSSNTSVTGAPIPSSNTTLSASLSSVNLSQRPTALNSTTAPNVTATATRSDKLTGVNANMTSFADTSSITSLGPFSSGLPNTTTGSARGIFGPPNFNSTGMLTDRSSRTAGTSLVNTTAPASNIGPAPFANATTTSPMVTATAAGNGTGSVSATNTVGPSAPLSRRCAQEGDDDWRSKVKREEAPVTMTFPDGQVVTKTWGTPKFKRQIGQIVTATIDGKMVTWTNNWNGAISVGLGSVPSSETGFIASSPVSSSLLTTPLVAVSLQQTTPLSSEVAQSSPVMTSSSLQNGGTVTLTTQSSNAGGISRHSGNTMITAEPPSSVATFSAASSELATDKLPSFHAPAWLTSIFPIDPTTPKTEEASKAQVTSESSSTPDSLTTESFGISSTKPASPTSTCTSNFAGDFTINFDDLPQVGEALASDQYPPLSNPYHKLTWSQGFTYVPPPSDPYSPHSGTQLGAFVVDGNANIRSQNWTGPIPQGDEVNGMFGAGENYQNPSFYIDAFGAWIGCYNSGPNDCDIQVDGFAYDDASEKSVVQVVQHFYQSPCPSLKNCSLEYFQFSDTFHNLTAVQIQASQQGDQKQSGITWYVDDISLAWTDNSCEAIQARDSSN